MADSISKKLAIIQQTLSVPKNQFNKYGNYKYRSCEDILEGLKPCLKSTNTILTIGDEIVEISGRFYVKATVILRDCESNCSVSNTAYAREEESKKGMDSSQITGSASSYARKYALNGLFCIDDVKDADTMDNSESKKKEEIKTDAGHKEQNQPEQERIDKIKLASLRDCMSKKGVKEKTVLDRYKLSDLSQMTIAQYADAMKGLAVTKEKKKEDVDLGL